MDIFPLLSSIDNQLGVDWNAIEVLIVNDRSKVRLSRRFLKQFHNCKPKYARLKKNVGQGPCRNAGMDMTTGEYIMFCDADDRFNMVIALWKYLKVIDAEHSDLIYSSYLVEAIDENGNTGFCTYNYNNLFTEFSMVHGKLYRRRFLEQNDIRFLDKFRCHEDVYFNGLAFNLADKINLIELWLYVWVRNLKSITRSNGGKAAFSEYSTFIDASLELLKVLAVKNPSCVQTVAADILLDAYINLNKVIFRYRGKDFIAPAEKKLGNLCKQYDQYLNKFMETELAAMAERKEKLHTDLVPLRESFTDFLKRIKSFEK
jgi:glycosyltransferase involved in cell wall biosynthesis